MTHATHRILHVEGNEDGTIGGSHRALVDLVLGIDRERFTPVVLFYQGNSYAETLRAKGVEVLLYERERTRERYIRHEGGRARKLLDFAAAVTRRARLIREHRIDLVHLNNSPLFGYSDWLPAARVAGRPCMTFAMGDAVITRPLNRWFARRFDHIIGCSRYMAEAMREVGVRADRLSWTHLGVDVEALRARVDRPAADVRRDLAVPEGAVLATMVGNLRRWKGQHVVLEAIGHLPAEIRARLHVRFVGAASDADEEYVSVLRARIADLGVGDQVRLAGPRSDVPTILAASDLAVHASTMPEPFGLVVPEAMAQGIPVVASKFGGPGEVLTDACGRVFDPAAPTELASHLERLVSDPSLRARLGSAALARIRQPEFGVREMVVRVVRAYERLLGTRPPRS
jgi:glycosyltransferase involved in cell wall biosynthesis